MSDGERELYQERLQAQLDEWKERFDTLKAQASEGTAEARQEINQRLDVLGDKIEQGEAKLVELIKAGDDLWESFKEDVEVTWKSLTATFKEFVSKD